MQFSCSVVGLLLLGTENKGDTNPLFNTRLKIVLGLCLTSVSPTPYPRTPNPCSTPFKSKWPCLNDKHNKTLIFLPGEMLFLVQRQRHSSVQQTNDQDPFQFKTSHLSFRGCFNGFVIQSILLFLQQQGGGWQEEEEQFFDQIWLLILPCESLSLVSNFSTKLTI